VAAPGIWRPCASKEGVGSDNSDRGGLALRSRLGLPRDWMDFGRLNVAGLTRDMVRRLAKEDITDLETLEKAPLEQLLEWLPDGLPGAFTNGSLKPRGIDRALRLGGA